MKLKLLIKIILDYKTYLFVGIFLIVLAPISEISHWSHRSIGFAKWAFILFCVSSAKIFLDTFLTMHPEFKKKLKTVKFKNKLWRR